MSRGKRIEFVAIALSMFGAFGPGLARCEVGVSTLRRIDKIKVVIEDLTGASRNDGITESWLQAQSEFELRQVGINVTDPNGKVGESLFVPVLYISVSADKSDGLVTFLIRLELLQAVSLARDPNITASSATTWSTFRFGRVHEHGYAKKVENMLNIMLQNFQDDFLSVNSAVWPPKELSVKASSVVQ
jgi:hypothetical protein